MKLIIPMAGIGKRLRPHTLTVPKPLLPIAGKTIVERVVESIAGMWKDRIEQIAFVVGDFGTGVENQLKQIASRAGAVPVIYRQEEALGTAHAILCAAPSLCGNIVIAFSDTLFKSDFVIEDSGDGILWVNKVSDPSAFGVVTLDDKGIITGFVEKPQAPVSDLAIVGIYYFRDGAHLKKEIQYIIDHNIRDKGEYQLTTAMENMRKKGARFTTAAVQEWLDFGNKDSTLLAHRRLLELENPKGAIADNIRRVRTEIISPCFIAPDAELVNSTIGPFVSVGPFSRIENSIVKESIIQSNSRISSVTLRLSMIGNFVEFNGDGNKSIIYEVSIGDYSVVR